MILDYEIFIDDKPLEAERETDCSIGVGMRLGGVDGEYPEDIPDKELGKKTVYKMRYQR